MAEKVRIFLMADTMDGKPGWWSAHADFDGSPAYDGDGRTPAEAFARLAQVLAEKLYEAQNG